jgi:hypothetical protein
MQACLIRDKRTWQLLKDYRKDDSGARLKTVTSIKVPTLASAQGCRISSPYPDKMPSFRFEHNLTRPYPFKWYTPAVLAGFTIATIIFSVLNYASTGYTLQAAYLPDPRPTSWPGMDSWYKELARQPRRRQQAVMSACFYPHRFYTVHEQHCSTVESRRRMTPVQRHNKSNAVPRVPRRGADRLRARNDHNFYLYPSGARRSQQVFRQVASRTRKQGLLPCLHAFFGLLAAEPDVDVVYLQARNQGRHPLFKQPTFPWER